VVEIDHIMHYTFLQHYFELLDFSVYFCIWRINRNHCRTRSRTLSSFILLFAMCTLLCCDNHYAPYTCLPYYSVSVEATPHYLWDYEGWEDIPGNRGLLEPRFILAHSLHTIRPDLKFLVILRNPVTR
jgi:hypothetical protein